MREVSTGFPISSILDPIPLKHRRCHQGNVNRNHRYQHPQNMHYNNGPVYPPQYYSPSVLEAHAPWKDTDLAKFFTTCKTLKLKLYRKNWSDYSFNFLPYPRKYHCMDSWTSLILMGLGSTTQRMIPNWPPNICV